MISDCIVISDDDDDDDDVREVLPHRKNCVEIIHLAVKGWKRCSTGFEEAVESENSSLCSNNPVKKTCTSRISNHGNFQNSTTKSQVCHISKRRKSLQHNIGSSCHFSKENFSSQSIETFDGESDDICSSPDGGISNVVGKHRYKVRKAKNWAFADLSNGFSESENIRATVQCSPPKKECFPVKTKSHRNVSLLRDISFVNINSSSPDISMSSSRKQRSVREEKCPHLEEPNGTEMDIEEIQEKQGSQNTPCIISSADSQETFHNQENKKIISAQRGSEWLQTINWHKTIHNQIDDEFCDKKERRTKRFIQGGLAERAQHIENRERTSKVLWSHKKPEMMNKLLPKSLSLEIQTCDTSEEMVLAKCRILKKPVASEIDSTVQENGVSMPNVTGQADSNNQGSEILGEHCILLLRISVLNDVQLKSGVQLQVFPPWQILGVPSLSCQVILCTYFIHILPSVQTKGIPRVENVSEEVIYTSPRAPSLRPTAAKPAATTVSPRASRSKMWPVQKSAEGAAVHDTDLLREQSHVQENSESCSLLSAFNICGTEISLCCRVQRVCCHVALSSDINYKPGMWNRTVAPHSPDLRYSLLLQDCNMHFCVLQFARHGRASENALRHILPHTEGKCLKFSKVKVLQKLHYTRYPLLFAYLRSVYERQHSNLRKSVQPVCYKVTTCDESSVIDISDMPHPPYSPLETLSLERLFVKNEIHPRRFSCIVKVICVVHGVLYVTDLSLRNREFDLYVRLCFCPSSFRPAAADMGSVVSIVEAIVQKGSLYVDDYSRVKVLSPVSKTSSYYHDGNENSRQPRDSIEKVSALNSMKFCCGPLNSSSGINDLVVVEGKVASVDRETAVSWLECDICLKEDLYQDSESRIFCEHCNRVVENPKLNMKMDVSVTVSKLPSSVIIIELTSLTTKNLLQIDSANPQPKCDVRDVLNKQIGPLTCYVKNKTIRNCEAKFELLELMLH